MLARLQRFVVAVILLVAMACAMLAWKTGHMAWGVVGVLAALCGHAVFLAGEFFLLHHLQGPGPPARASLLQLLRAWLAESVTAPRVFFWRQPFRSKAEPDHIPDGAHGLRGVVLVHGFVCNRGLWNPWMRELRARGTPFVAVNLEPVFDSIDSYPPLIEAAVARLEQRTGRPVVVVGHSMGGLAIRAWLQRFASDARVHRVITIGTPHQGTWLARFGHTTNGREMRQRSPWLTALAAVEPAARANRFTCFYGHCDNIVFPTLSGTLPGARNVHVPGTAHVHMAFQPVVFQEVCRWLDPPSDATAPTSDDLLTAAR